NNVVNNGCSIEVEEVLNEVYKYLQKFDLSSIKSDDPIASEILDICEGVDKVIDNLSIETMQILADIKIDDLEFSEDINNMLNEFINIYNLLESNFDPAFVKPISFSQNEKNLDKRRILLTIFDLLKGFLRPLLDERDRPDLQVLLMLDSDECELVFTEISQLGSHSNKQNYDWKKLNRLCKDGFDTRIRELFKEKNVETNEAK
ncbi:407_t:CDS:2, partial [Funneliformis mosseae]